MRLIFTKEHITGAGYYRSWYQDEVILNGGVDFGKTESGHYIVPSSEPAISELLAMIADGVEVTDMPVVVRAPASILDEDVFEGLPFRIENDQVIKFNSWGQQPLILSNDELEVLLVCTVNGRYLNGSEWAIFNGKPGVALLDKDEYQNLISTDPNWIKN